MKEKLLEIRERIDEINENILILISERNKLAKEIIKIKKELCLPIYDPEREKDIFKKNTM